MYVERELRDQLNALSKQIFGVASRWQKMLEVTEMVTVDVVEKVPAVLETQTKEDGSKVDVEVTPETTKTVKRAALLNGRPYKIAKYNTPEEILAKLQTLKVQQEEFMAKMAEAEKKEKDKKEAQKQAEEAIKELQGSAI